MLSQDLQEVIVVGVLIGEIGSWRVAANGLKGRKISVLFVVLLRGDVHLQTARVGAVVGLFAHAVNLAALQHFLLNHLVLDQLRHEIINNGSWRHGHGD